MIQVAHGRRGADTVSFFFARHRKEEMKEKNEIHFADGSSESIVEEDPMPEFANAASTIAIPKAQVPITCMQTNAIEAQFLNSQIDAAQTVFLPSVEKDRYIRKLRDRRAALVHRNPPSASVRGLSNMGNTCYLNAVLQLFSSLRVLQKNLPDKKITIWQDLQEVDSIPAYLRMLCEQLSSMRRPPQTYDKLKMEQRRLQSLSKAVASSIFHEKTGLPQDATQLVQTVLQAIVDARPYMGCLFMFGMCSINSDTNKGSVYEESMLSVHLNEFKTLERLYPKCAPNETDLEFALRVAFPDQRRVSMTGDSYLFPLVGTHPQRGQYPSRYAFGETWLIGILLNWFRGYDPDKKEPILTELSHFSFPSRLHSDTRIGVAYTDDTNTVKVDALPMFHKKATYPLRAVLLHKNNHYFTYIRKNKTWWRMDDDAEPCNITCEVNFDRGKLATQDENAKPLALFYENTLSNVTDE